MSMPAQQTGRWPTKISGIRFSPVMECDLSSGVVRGKESGLPSSAMLLVVSVDFMVLDDDEPRAVLILAASARCHFAQHVSFQLREVQMMYLCKQVWHKFNVWPWGQQFRCDDCWMERFWGETMRLLGKREAFVLAAWHQVFKSARVTVTALFDSHWNKAVPQLHWFSYVRRCWAVHVELLWCST